MFITSKIMIDGNLETVNVNAAHVVYYFRDRESRLVRLRLIDGSEAVTDLRVARVAEIVEGKA